VLEETDAASLEALNDAFIHWVSAYNTKEHSSHGKTPMDVYRTEEQCLRRPQSAEWVSEAFLNRVCRTVKGDATITIDRISYDVPMSFIGQKVEVRFLPDDMTAAHIVCEGKAYPCRPTDKAANFKARRKSARYLIDYTDKGDDRDVSPTLPTHS
jgi:hypothetical protein